MRHKDSQWGEYAEANLGVLMDLRDELKALNRIFGCHNFLKGKAKKI